MSIFDLQKNTQAKGVFFDLLPTIYRRLLVD